MFATIFTLSTRGANYVWIWAWEGRSTWYLGIDLSLLQPQCSVTQAANGSLILKRGRGDYRTLPCSVSEQLKTLAWETGTFPVGLDTNFSTDCVIKDQSDVSFMHIPCHLHHGVHSHLHGMYARVYVLIKHYSSILHLQPL